MKLLSQNGPSPGATCTRTGAVIGIFSLAAFSPEMYLNKRPKPVDTASSKLTPETTVEVHFKPPGYNRTSYVSPRLSTVKGGQSLPRQNRERGSSVFDATRRRFSEAPVSPVLPAKAWEGARNASNATTHVDATPYRMVSCLWAGQRAFAPHKVAEARG